MTRARHGPGQPTIRQWRTLRKSSVLHLPDLIGTRAGRDGEELTRNTDGNLEPFTRYVGHAIGTHLRILLRNGGSYAEAKETILHATMFAGFPRALSAMRALARKRGREGARGDDEGGHSDP